MITIFLLSLVGAIIAAVVGTLWYSNSTPMGKIHMRYLGFDKMSAEDQKKAVEEAKPTMPKIYLAQLALSFLSSFLVVFIVTMSMRNGLSLWLGLGFVLINWFGFVVPTIGSAMLWGNCDKEIAWKKFFSDIFSNLVSLLIIALIASFFV